MFIQLSWAIKMYTNKSNILTYKMHNVLESDLGGSLGIGLDYIALDLISEDGIVGQRGC